MLQVSADLATAVSVTEANAHSITMVVPARNGDPNLETIRYYWSGVAGSDVTRQYNGAAPSAVAHNVYKFDLLYASGPFAPWP